MAAERRRGRLVAVLLALAASAAGAEPARLALCQSCHGAAGLPAAPGIPSIAGQPRTFVENQLVIMREGLREVPAMKAAVEGLTDAQIAELAQHFAALKPVAVPVAARRPDAKARGQALSQRGLCGTCHLPDYAGQAQVPRLAGQDEAYLLYAMKQFRDHPGPGRDTIMAATLLGLNDAQLADLAHHLATAAP